MNKKRKKRKGMSTWQGVSTVGRTKEAGGRLMTLGLKWKLKRKQRRCFMPMFSLKKRRKREKEEGRQQEILCKGKMQAQ